jgi:hypothetical protein
MSEKVYKELKKVVENIYVYEDQMIEIACHIDRHYTKKTEQPKRKTIDGVLPLTDEELKEFIDLARFGRGIIKELEKVEYSDIDDMIFICTKDGAKHTVDAIKAILYLANLFDLEG